MAFKLSTVGNCQAL